MNKSDLIKKHSDTHQIYPLNISRLMIERIEKSDKNSSLRKQFLPDPIELDKKIQETGMYDPIADSKHSKGNGIIHRYESRVLFTPTTACPINCRYCFRKNELAAGDDIFKSNLSALVEYLYDNPKVEEVILTGGDPLSLSNSNLENIFSVLSSIIPYIRIHSRYLTVAPERFDQELLDIFTKYQNQFESFSIAIHANHIDEFNDEINDIARKLHMTGINLISQTVLLRDVNSSVKDLVDLMKLFIKLKIRPYYLHHPDRVKGAMHFYMTLEEGRTIYGQMRDQLPGWALPTYIMDPSNGNGKNFAYNPESIIYSGQLLDRNNQVYSYPELG